MSLWDKIKHIYFVLTCVLPPFVGVGLNLINPSEFPLIQSIALIIAMYFIMIIGPYAIALIGSGAFVILSFLIAAIATILYNFYAYCFNKPYKDFTQ